MSETAAQHETPLISSARFLTGDLIKICVAEIRQLQVPWGALPEADQQKVIDRITDVTTRATRQVVQLIAGLDRPSVQAEIESVTFKDGIKVVLTMSKRQADRHEIADATGAGVLLVLPAYDAVSGGEPPKPQPDQPRLDGLDDDGNAPPPGEPTPDGPSSEPSA